MRIIIYAAIGFWISRQFYEHYLKAQHAEKVTKLKRELNSYLSGHGWSPEEIQEAELEIFKENESKN